MLELAVSQGASTGTPIREQSTGRAVRTHLFSTDMLILKKGVLKLIYLFIYSNSSGCFTAQNNSFSVLKGEILGAMSKIGLKIITG